MLETVIKFHRLKYVRGKNEKTWLTMVLESIGSVGGEEGSGLGTSQSSFWQGWAEMGKGVHTMLHLAVVVPWEQKESIVKSGSQNKRKKKRKKTPKVDSMTTW